MWGPRLFHAGHGELKKLEINLSGLTGPLQGRFRVGLPRRPWAEQRPVSWESPARAARTWLRRPGARGPAASARPPGAGAERPGRPLAASEVEVLICGVV